MAFVDFHFVWSGHFAKLQLPTRALLYVITAVCNHQTGEFHHSVETLAHLAGISRRSGAYALRELETHDPPIVSTTPRPGKPAVKTHLPTARFTHGRDASHAGGPASPAGVPLQDLHPNNNRSEQQETTTAADRISPPLIKAMVDLYGPDVVSRVVVAMKDMNGEVNNANAYFRVCCEKNFIPTNKKARQRQEKQRRKEAIRRKQEKSAREHQKMLTDFEESDPAVAEAAFAQIAKLLE